MLSAPPPPPSPLSLPLSSSPETCKDLFSRRTFRQERRRVASSSSVSDSISVCFLLLFLLPIIVVLTMLLLLLLLLLLLMMILLISLPELLRTFLVLAEFIFIPNGLYPAPRFLCAAAFCAFRRNSESSENIESPSS